MFTGDRAQGALITLFIPDAAIGLARRKRALGKNDNIGEKLLKLVFGLRAFPDAVEFHPAPLYMHK